MPRNGSGTYSLPSGNPVVTGTVISSTWANNTLSDIATALTNSLAKDGQTTPTGNIPLGGNKITGLGAPTLRTDAAQLASVQNSQGTALSSASGTNTITAALDPALTAYTSGQRFTLIPAATNTGATTLNINGLGAKNVYRNGVACVGGELWIGVPIDVFYDGTQFNVLPVSPTLRAIQATTSGTSIDFTSIPNWVRKVTVLLNGVSTNGTANLLIQIGSGSVATSGYASVATSSSADTQFSAGFGIASSDASNTCFSVMTIVLEDSANYVWLMCGTAYLGTVGEFMSGTKTLSGALDRVRLTTSNGTDVFDSGSFSIMYE